MTPVLTQRDGKNFVVLRVSSGALQGVSQEIPWEAFFGASHAVPTVESKAEATQMTKKTVKSRSEKQERKRIEAVGGRRHAGSGSLSGNKSDGSLGDRYRMENKFTTAASYRVTLSDLSKLWGECRNGQQPVFNVDFQDRQTGATKDSWVMIPSKEWSKLVNATSNTE